MNVGKAFSFLLVGVAAFALGILLGVSVQGGQEAQNESGSGSEQESVSLPDSPVLGEWTNNAVGNIAEITSDTITIERNGSLFSAPLHSDIPVTKRVSGDNGPVDAPDEVTVSDLKVGDLAAVVIAVREGGDTETRRIFLLPNPQQPQQ